MTPSEFMKHQKVMSEVTKERLSQEEKWGQQDHDDNLFLVILGEEYGEACQAALKMFETMGETHGAQQITSTYHLRAELVQVAAVAIAHIESIDRRTDR